MVDLLAFEELRYEPCKSLIFHPRIRTPISVIAHDTERIIESIICSKAVRVELIYMDLEIGIGKRIDIEMRIIGGRGRLCRQHLCPFRG